MYDTMVKVAVLLAGWFVMCAINDSIEYKEQKQADKAEAARQRELARRRIAWTVNNNRHILWDSYTKENTL